MSAEIRYDPQLLEEVVWLELRCRVLSGDIRLLREYHRRADPLHYLNGERRERAFAALHRQLFQELGFEARVEAVLNGHRTVLARAESLTFLRAFRPGEEGADLGRPQATGRPAVVRLRASRFLAPVEFTRFLDHELVHLRDLLDPEFAHDPDALAGIPPHRRRLVQERYRLAWAISVDGRLVRQGRAPLADRKRRREDLARCFSALSGVELERLFDALWNDDRPTHARLLAMATSTAGASPQPGAQCPLCGFPTYRWAEVSGAALIEAIRLDVPMWQPADGLCERCLEVYQVRSLAGR